MARTKRVIAFLGHDKVSNWLFPTESLLRVLFDKQFAVSYLTTHKLPHSSDSLAEQNLITPLFTSRSSGIVFWLLYSLFAPWSLLSLSFRCRSRAIFVFSPSASLLAKLASIFSWTPVYLFLNHAPWQSEARCRKGFIKRFLFYLFDCIGIFCANKVMVPSDFVRQEIASQFFLFPKKTASFPYLSNSPLLSNNLHSVEDDTREKENNNAERRKELAQKFVVPEKNTILVTIDGLFSHSNVEPLLRALSALDRENISLIIFGSGPELTAAKSVTVGLGLYNQVVFADRSELLLEHISGSDIFVVPATCCEAMELLLKLVQNEVAVLSVDSPFSREVLFYEELLYKSGDVQFLAERLGDLCKNKDALKELEKLSYQRGKLYSPDWAEFVNSFLS